MGPSLSYHTHYVNFRKEMNHVQVIYSVIPDEQKSGGGEFDGGSVTSVYSEV